MSGLVLDNVRVAGDGGRPIAVAVDRGVFTSVGGEAPRDMSALRLDCEGCVIAPGFIDAHSHPLAFAEPEEVNISNCFTLEQVMNRIRDVVARSPKGAWIEAVGNGDGRSLEEGRVPTTAELDTLSPDCYIAIRCGTRASVNSPVLSRIRQAPDAVDTDDSPRTSEVWAAWQRGPRHSVGALREELARMSALGITTVMDFGSSGYDFTFDHDLAVYRALRDEGDARVRSWVSYRVPVGANIGDVTDDLKARGYRTGDGDDLVRIGPVKLVVDGGGFDGALLREDYPGRPGYRGNRFVEDEEIRALTDAAVSRRWSMAIHAIGGAAIDSILGVWEGFGSVCSELRFSIEHAFQPSDDTLRLCRELGIFIGVQQPLFYRYGEALTQLWGASAAERSNPIREWLDADVALAGGSDTTPQDPLLAMWSMTTRKIETGAVLGPQQVIAPADAFRIYTTGAAARLGSSARVGTISPGKLADAVLLNDDPAESADPERVKVMATFMNGSLTFVDPDVPRALDALMEQQGLPNRR
jgi:predicted amidohydrolase YtcJ